MEKKRRNKGSSKAGRNAARTKVMPNLAAALERAEYYARHGQESDIPGLLSPFEKNYPFKDVCHSEKYDRLMAFGLSYVSDFPRAEKVIERALSSYPPSRDILFAQAFVELSMREYERTVQTCRSYFELDEGAPSQPNGPVEITATPAFVSQVNNFLGAALGQLNQPGKAIEAYLAAIGSNPANHLPYLNLAGMHRNLNQLEQAALVVEQGLSQCSRVDELRMLQESLKHRSSISACLMVKDEEELLPGCLDSLRDWVDEIIVVDTGSTDRTVAIAQEYGARIFHQPWENNFSKHRNYSIDQATGDWIFIIDADERIVTEDVPLIISAVNDSDYKILSINVLNMYGENKDRTTYVNSVRFFQSSLGLRYEGIVHNTLVLPPDKQVLRTRIGLTHLGYDLSAEKMKQKFERTRDLLKQQLEVDPDNTFALFNYAELLRGVDPNIKPENASEIIRSARRVVELTRPEDRHKRHLHLMCLCQLAAVHLQQKQFDKALEYCELALVARPDYFDALIYAGFAHHGLQEYEQAIKQFERYLEVQAGFNGTSEEDPVIISYPHSRDLACNNLGILYQLNGEPRRALEYYEETLKINPQYGETASFLGRLYRSEGKVEKAEHWFRHQLDNSVVTADALIGLAQILEGRGETGAAQQYIARAVDAFPENPQVFLEQGRLLAGSGQEEAAIEAFDRALLLGNEDQAEFSIARLCYENRLWGAAAIFYERGLNKYEETPELLNDLGNCFYKLDDLDQAEDSYIRATALSPTLPLAYRNLGLVQARLGKQEQAISALESYLDVNPDEWDIRLLAADLCRQSEQYGTAVAHYEKILLAEPENRSALLGLSESYYLMGHEDTAMLGFRRLLRLDPDCQLAQERVRELAGLVPQV